MAVRVLCDYGLVEADCLSREQNESGGYSIHGCVHLWIVCALEQKLNCDPKRLVLKLVELYILKEDSPKHWLTGQRLIPYVTRCAYLVLNGLVSGTGIDWTLYDLGVLYHSHGKPDEAEKIWQYILQRYEKNFNPDQHVLYIFGHLGLAYMEQGKLAEAEKMYMQELQGRKTLGSEYSLAL